MLLMIFASRHLSMCCSPSFRLQSLLQLINLAQPAGAAGCGRGAPPRVWSPRVNGEGWQDQNGGGRGDPGREQHPKTSCRAPPSPAPALGNDIYYFFSHGKALVLRLQDGASSFGGQD